VTFRVSRPVNPTARGGEDLSNGDPDSDQWPMLSIGTITAGAGYQYLTSEVASGAEDYYIRAGAGSGEAQGWWLGEQRQAFGVDGELVREEQMKAFFGTKSDPETGERLGAKFRIYATVAERLAKAETEHQGWVEADLATRAAALQTAGAGEQRWAESLAAHRVAASERWEKTRLRIVRAGERNSVAGYDLTFSAPKSVSVLWASAPDTAAQGTVRAAHHEGVLAVMAVLERDGAFVRRGRNGVRQEKVSGVLAAAFDHRTSRTGDPQMHTHVAVLAMAKASDGRVLALDGRAIYGLSGALSAIYDFYRDKALMRELNVRFEVNERTGVREIAGVPGSLQELWSSRRAQITPRVEELKAQYLATHGRQAPPELVAKMAQWATLDTRPAKGEPERTEELFARWRAAASASADTDLAEVWAAAVGRGWLAPAAAQTDQQIAETVMARLEAEKATWTVPNVMQVVWQVMERDPNTTAEEDEARAARVVDAVFARDDVLKLTPSMGLDLPAELVREDGEAVYQVHMAGRFATHSAVNEEQYLVARCRSRTNVAVPVDRIETAIAAAEGPGLSDDQAAVVRGVLGSTGAVNVIVGPAGTGKTTTMRVVSNGWQANGGRVLGLALSQTAANELAAATGGRAENIAKLLYETRRIDPEVFPGHAAKWRLEAGQLVIMDEAGMTDRQAMVAVARLCEQAGAKLVLVGDHEQLESPDARGAMRLMARVAETFELGQVHRFVNYWERDASLRLRAGDVEVLDEYAAHGRIYGGTAEANDHRAVRLALADHLSGRRAFILAGTNEPDSSGTDLSRTAWWKVAVRAWVTATWPGSETGSCAGATTGRSRPAGDVS
jgi:conjugative relaxase-like TrwC/TraI family protein